MSPKMNGIHVKRATILMKLSNIRNKIVIYGVSNVRRAAHWKTILGAIFTYKQRLCGMRLAVNWILLNKARNPPLLCANRVYLNMWISGFTTLVQKSITMAKTLFVTKWTLYGVAHYNRNSNTILINNAFETLSLPFYVLLHVAP